MHFPEHGIDIVLNRCAKDSALTEQEIETALHRPIAVRIPESYRDMAASINSGVPVIMGRNHNLAAAFGSWSDHLIGMEAAAAEEPQNSRKWFGLFRVNNG
jgi:septum formation inhibitor-activating ATPase MinD